MINSDDLILDERSGPLGTGAFGAVYRGVWRVQIHDSASTHSVSSLYNTRISSNASPSALTNSTQLQSQSLEYEESMGTEQGSSQPLLLRAEQDRTQASDSPAKFHPKCKMIHVAVKILNDVRGSSDLDALLDEAKVMASVSHRHCLPLLGVCLSQSRKCLVSAYVDNGSLERYLRAHRPNIPFGLLIKWCEQIANGMTYLQSRGIIHRDLATRNVLVTSRDHVQITDFGLAKMTEADDEETGGELVLRSGRVPIRWLAIETLTHGRYSFKTDVWAYGVTIWEIFSFGKKPYWNIETNNVKSHVLAGNRLPQPASCNVELYRIMRACWNENPYDRPSFVTLFGFFRELALNPDVFAQARGSGSIRTESADNTTTSNSPSRMTLESDLPTPTGFQTTGTQQTAVPDNSTVAETTALPPSRRLNFSRRRIRSSLVVPPTHHSPFGRFTKYQQQKRRSTGCRPDNFTLSTSLSMTSSGLSDHWTHSGMPNLSHPILTDIQEHGVLPGDAQIEVTEFRQEHAQSCRNPAPFNHGGVNTDSWASSGQPLLASYQDNSLSHLVLTNLGYTSSSSHASMLNPLGGQTPMDNNLNEEPVRSTALAGVGPVSMSRMPTTMPSNLEIEAAAGYVWPQWPSVLHDLPPSDAMPLETNESSSAGDDELTHLTRQLWLRRNERQRQFYLRQMQLQRANFGMSPPEQSEPGSVNGVNETGLSGESDVTGNAERYCPDPSS